MTAVRPSGRIGSVIRNAVIHVSNEQPLLADLFGVPTAADAGLLCTNLRMMDGKRPVFIDNIAATFFFPYLVIRFVEIPPGAMARHIEEGGDAPVGLGSSEAADGDAERRLPALAAAAESSAGDVGAEDPDLDLDIDEDFLKRVRDI